MSDAADQRQRTIDSLNTSIETWAESTGRRDDPVKSTGGMFFDPAESTFGEYAWNRLAAAVPVPDQSLEEAARWLCDRDQGGPWDDIDQESRGLYRGEARELLAIITHCVVPADHVAVSRETARNALDLIDVLKEILDDIDLLCGNTPINKQPIYDLISQHRGSLISAIADDQTDASDA